jgi:hypothetical protein
VSIFLPCELATALRKSSRRIAVVRIKCFKLKY